MTLPNIFMRSTLAATIAAVAFTATAGHSTAAGYPVGGKIAEEYAQATAANGMTGNQFFGDAITRELDAARDGKYQKFYNNSSIYWHPLVSNGHANQIGGSIRDKWLEPLSGLVAEWGPLKYPTTRETAARKPGRFNHFEGGSIYWSSNTGAHRIWGQIRDIWSAADWEAGRYGFPTTDEFNCATADDSDEEVDDYGAFGQRFEDGWIVWNTGSFTDKGGSVVKGDQLRIGRTHSWPYEEELQSAVNAWDLGSIDITTGHDIEFAPLKLDVVDEPSEDYAGLYSYYDENGGVGWIDMNEPNIEGPDNARNVFTHEMGHALGLEHSCQGQLMDPVSNSTVFGPQYMDVKAYHDNWG